MQISQGTVFEVLTLEAGCRFNAQLNRISHVKRRLKKESHFCLRWTQLLGTQHWLIIISDQASSHCESQDKAS